MNRPRPDAGFPLPPIGAPPMMSRPPQQLFGNTFDRLPPIHLPADMAAAHMFGSDPNAYMDDANEAKRRRIARACDMCRKKKIKCDGKMPSCTHCVNYKTKCVFTQVEKKRNPPKGAKYIEGLENRLGRMESLLRLSGLLGEDDGATDLGTLERKLAEKLRESGRGSLAAASNASSPSQATSANDGDEYTPRSSLTSPEPGKDGKDGKDGETGSGSRSGSGGGENRSTATPDKKGAKKEEEVEALSEMMCSLVTNNYGETRYIGSSSGFSIFSPKGMQWVNEKTGDNSFQQMISNVSLDDNKWTNWKPEIFADLFSRPVFRPLPPKAEALSLLKDFFENFNCMFPLFHHPTFMHLVERQYSKDPYQGSGWWASLNVALAIAHRLRVMSNLVPQEEDDKAWAYLKNAMAVFSELAMRNTDLLSVQALLGMALFMQGTPNPQPTFLLIAAAIRLSHSIGLHKKGTGFNLNPIEIEQRKRVFWIGYMLDKDLCLRSGRPPAQDDDDMNVELPDADPADNIGNIPLADGKGKMNLFRVMCEFATIESRVYKRLYATKATKQTIGELLNTIGELDQQLEDWKDRIPIDFRPEHEIKASHTPLILHVVMLHFTYYNCLTTIHRMCVHHGYWTSRLSDYAIQGLNAKPLNPRIYSSATLCVSSARASISLLKYIPQGDFSCVWLILYFPVSSLVTLFGNTLQNPLDPRARSDTRLMNLVVTFLSMLGQEAESGGVHRMLGVCSEFERIANIVIDKAEKEQASRRKRKNQDPHEVETAHRPAPSITKAAKTQGAVAAASSAAAAASASQPTSRAQSLAPQPQPTPTPRPASSCSTTTTAYHNTPSATPAEAAAAALTAAEIVNSHRMGSQKSHGSRVNPAVSLPIGNGGGSSAVTTAPSPNMASADWDSVFAGGLEDHQQHQQQQAGAGPTLSGDAANFMSFTDIPGFETVPGSGLPDGLGNMQSPPVADLMPSQPFLPQDIFNLPMTLDWDWAEMSGGAYPSVENGNFDLMA
ncbi:fungal specific transcription factor [Grosmannia clavigera kw1407]|uniref:Fungal specific transcription factor n=1 Tax=Grosmannia clavigera (strain kw1407 / UAMH 11150) TaxID=655863 RepID=F0XIM9_GROCL|nr:fungal specific transcription factor [Grosmannia clavigera kw1407]EFX02513.1 fungal specific transcription factor [Grosmannia clavigera kw1407]